MSARSGQTRWQRFRQVFADWEPLVTCVAAVAGVALYFIEIPDRREARETLAWQILALQHDHVGNGGQRWAMEVLARDGVNMHGIHETQADLSADYEKSAATPNDSDIHGANLAGARMNWSMLWRSNLGRATLTHASLRNAKLMCAVLRDTDFTGADLSYADLRGAEITAANFTGAITDGMIIDRSTCVFDRQPIGLKLPAPLSRCPDWDSATYQRCGVSDPDKSPPTPTSK